MSGCFNPTGSGGTAGMPAEGHLWCAEADGAQAFYPSAAPVDIVDPDNEDGPARACLCASDEQDGELDAIAVNGVSVVTVNETQDLRDFRDEVFLATDERCDELVGELATVPTSDSCSQSLVAGTTPMFPIAGECTYDDESAMLDAWSDYYSLGSVISLNPANATYEIDQAFFADMLDNPNWFYGDSATIGHNGTSFQFYGVQSGDIVAALGIQTGDRPFTLNGLDVTTVPGAFAAHQALRDETEFEFVVSRGATRVLLRYEVVP